jgi:hypothetical protein
VLNISRASPDDQLAWCDRMIFVRRIDADGRVCATFLTAEG